MTRRPLSVTVALATAPGWYEPEGFWSTHRYDGVIAEAPYREKPKIELTAGYGETLGEVIDRAGKKLGLAPGPRFDEYDIHRLSQHVAYMGFYRPEDEAGAVPQRFGGWPTLLPVATLDGSVELRPWQEITYRDLLVSSKLGLVEGDVRRPYVHGGRPQGDLHNLVEAGRLTSEIVRATYDTVPKGRDFVDDAMRVVFVYTGLARAFRWRRARSRARTDRKRLETAVRRAHALGFYLTVEKYPADVSTAYKAEAASYEGELKELFLGNGATPGYTAQRAINRLEQIIADDDEPRGSRG